jgi:hypothetical protein
MASKNGGAEQGLNSRGAEMESGNGSDLIDRADLCKNSLSIEGAWDMTALAPIAPRIGQLARLMASPVDGEALGAVRAQFRARR